MLDLILGGAASGKSGYAEQLAAEKKRNSPNRALYYLATMHTDLEEETQARIRRHRAMREGKGFLTIEQESHLEQLTLTDGILLLEDLSNLLANEMYREQRTKEEIFASLKYLAKENELIIVSNEIFSDGKKYDAFTEAFLKNLAWLHQRFAADELCRSVTEVVVGIPLTKKKQEDCACFVH